VPSRDLTDSSSLSGLVAIVDYGVGNIMSIQLACSHVGLSSVCTADKEMLQRASCIILPGVGAFGDAMATLRSLDLVEPLLDHARSGKMLVGICLGIQLLMTESFEFGRHKGLGLIPGEVVRFDNPRLCDRPLKVPHVGWNAVKPVGGRPPGDTLLQNVPPGSSMYFVHSYHVRPQSDDVVLTTTQYGDVTFCSSVALDNVTAFQFHPERSGEIGLRVYENIKKRLQTTRVA